MADETHERRLSDKLKIALDVAIKNGRTKFDEQIRLLYEAVVMDEVGYDPNRRATDGKDSKLLRRRSR